MFLNLIKTFFLLFISTSFLQGQQLDSLLNKLPKVKNDKEKILLLEEITGVSFYQSPNRMEHYINDLITLSKKTNNQKGMAGAYFLYSKLYLKKQELEKATFYAEKADTIYRKQKDTLGLAKVITQQGVIRMKKNDFDYALKLYHQSLDYCVQIGDEKQEAINWGQIGALMFKTLRFDEGIQYSHKSLAIFKKIKADRETSLALLNLSSFYLNIKKVDEALKSIEEFFQIQKNIKDSTTIAFAKLNLAEIYKTQEKYDLAIKSYTESYHYYSCLKDTLSIANVLSNSMVLYFEIGEYDQSLKDAREALSLMENIKDDMLISDIYYYIYLIYRHQGNYQKALTAFENAYNLRDAVVNLETNNRISELKEQFDTEKKEKENITLKKNNAIQNLKLQNSRLIIIGVVFLLFVTAVISLLVIRFNKVKTREKHLQLQQKLLISQMNPHFIFNSLNSIQNFIYKQDTQNAATYLSQFSELMRMILMFSRKDHVSLAEEKKLLERYLEIQKLRFGDKLEWNIMVDEEIDEENVLIQPMLAQPFIENSLEHGLFKKEGVGNIFVRFKKEGDFLIFEIEDNGVGLNHAGKPSLKSNHHESLSTIITSERITGIKTLTGKNTTFEIINLSDFKSESQGVKVVFRIPYQTIL